MCDPEKIEVAVDYDGKNGGIIERNWKIRRKKWYNLPDKTTRSLTERPLERKLVLREEILAKGGGKLINASLEIDTLPSLLPVGTSHSGPPI